MSVRFSTIILFISLLAAACGGAKHSSGGPFTYANGSSDERGRLQEEFLFLNANKEKMLGNYTEALKLLKECLGYNPKNHAALYLMGSIYLHDLKDEGKALEWSKKAVVLDPLNSWYQVLLAEVYLQMKMYREAASTYGKLIEMEPEKVSHHLNKADMELRAGKYDDALKTYERIEKNFGLMEDVIRNKEEIYISLGKYGKAIEEIKKLVAAYPNDLNYLGMLAELYAMNKMDEKAIELFNKILELEPENANAHFALSEYYLEKGDKPRSFDEMKKAFAAKSDIKPKLEIMVKYMVRIQESPEMRQEAFTLAGLLIDNYPGDPSSHVVYGDLLFNDKNFEQAQKQYNIALDLDNSNFRVWQQLLLTDDKLKNYEDLQLQTEKALELFPDQPVLYLYNCFANMQLKKYNKVVTAATQGIEISGGQEIKAQLYSSLGDAQNFLKNYNASDKAFENALGIDSNNTYVLNNYSYFLSLRGEKLQRAEELSRKSLALEPANSSYMDTYGWILYKMKRYGEAKEWVGKAIQTGGENGEVLEHFGDILFKLNDEAGAVMYWKKAKESGSDSALIDKKIRDGKFYE